MFKAGDQINEKRLEVMVEWRKSESSTNLQTWKIEETCKMCICGCQFMRRCEFVYELVCTMFVAVSCMCVCWIVFMYCAFLHKWKYECVFRASVYVCACVSVCACLNVCVFVCVCVSVCTCVCVYVCICVYARLCVYACDVARVCMWALSMCICLCACLCEKVCLCRICVWIHTSWLWMPMCMCVHVNRWTYGVCFYILGNAYCKTMKDKYKLLD